MRRRGTRAVSLLVRDPRAFWTRLRHPAAGPASHRNARTRRRVLDVNGIRFEIDLDLDPRMRAMLRGRYQPDLVRLLERILRDGDSFIDVGANIGFISAVGLGQVGVSGEVHAFEPVPRYLERLRGLAASNPSHRLIANGVALGDCPGTAPIAVTNLDNIGWNTMVPGFMQAEFVAETIDVPVTTLDLYLAEHPMRRLSVVKIDTEGFEFPVLRGFEKSLRELVEPPVLIVEIAPSAYGRLDASLADLDRYMRGLGFVPYDLTLEQPVEVTALQQTTDVVFVRGGS